MHASLDSGVPRPSGRADDGDDRHGPSARAARAGDGSRGLHGPLYWRRVAGLAGLGLDMLVDAPHRLPMLNTVRVPAGVDESAVRRELREKHHIEIGAGLGPLAGKVWRIGLMGHTARDERVDRLLEALRSALAVGSTA